jgi:hypothetical protein
MAGSSQHSTVPASPAASRLGSIASDSEEYAEPMLWPAISSSVSIQGSTLLLRLRVCRHGSSTVGSTWSEPVSLPLNSKDASAVVRLPFPAAGVDAAAAPAVPVAPSAGSSAAAGTPPVAQPAHLVTVQATKQPGPFGTLLLHIMPTFLLQNSLPVTLQYKQAGSSTVHSLQPLQQSAVQWADASMPFKLVWKVQEPGWSWSGAVALDTPGETFIKMHNRWVKAAGQAAAASELLWQLV